MDQPPRPPYYAVIFTSTLSSDTEGYGEMADRMDELAAQQPGYLGIDSVRDGAAGITVSYWRDEASIESWKQNLEHAQARERGRGGWYADYQIHVARVERSYGYRTKG